MKSNMESPFSLTNKTIVVTGASSGIGRQCAITCSLLRASVILVGRNEERLSETLNQMERPHDHMVITVDLTNNDLLQTMAQQIAEAKGKLHGIIHAAGISTTLPLRMINEEKLDHFFHTNVSAAILLTKLLVKPAAVSDSGMSVVFITSVMATVGEA
ncbi:MAG: SDR family oxidoreductase, partial [Imperialibacter sp.]